MAKKAAVTAPAKAKKPTVKDKLATLSATIRAYFSAVRYRRPDYTIQLKATIAGEGGVQKVHMVNVPSLIASITTAQHLNKEIKLRAVEDPTGGALLIEFYAPITVGDQIDLLS